MEKAPETHSLTDGTLYWSHTFTKFEATVLVPEPDERLNSDILNYGFIAPYLLVFSEKKLNTEEARIFAEETGLLKIAGDFASSVLFIYPTAQGGWKKAPPDLFAEIISNSRIHQYYKDGYIQAKNRFTHTSDGYFIRGAIFRTCLFGFGESADYIAENCLTHFEGDGLWGKADIAPVTCFLTGLSDVTLLPGNQKSEKQVQNDSQISVRAAARDIPIVSYSNSAEINNYLRTNFEHFMARQKPDIPADFYAFARKFRRMLGTLEVDPDLEADGLIREPAVITLRTSSDNCGDDMESRTHKVGYFAFYNRGLLDKNSGSQGSSSSQSSAQDGSRADSLSPGKVPLLLGFHGGGDSCFFFSIMAGWAKIAHRHNFLLVTVENHLNSTVTEMQELIEHLKAKYPVDESRIYATGFSMGGCKSWDFVQEYPLSVAAAAPMDATFEVGLNLYGNPISTQQIALSTATGPKAAQSNPGLNTTQPLPVFYAGGEITPLPELPFQAQKCLDRMKYILELNGATANYDVKLEEKESWKNKIWGIDGDLRYTAFDTTRGSTLTMELFKNKRGKIWNAFASISGQGHDCREHTCEHAWRFMRCFSRAPDGTIIGGDPQELMESLTSDRT
ncbi:MAG: hypothetical protein K5930_05265 [Treponemataceae bacterium]|nr:hypothetical protein [Treponemataceae bacterium]